MPKLIAVSRLTITFLTFASIAALAAPPADHPIIGTWKIIGLGGTCSETYKFRADGTTLVTSASEVAESIYEISSAVRPSRFYRLVDKVSQSNGRPDCSGEFSKVGDESTRFLRMHSSGQMFEMCATESLTNCIGPAVRLREQNI